MRVVQLFKGHRNLILGFNAFLPKTHHIDPNIQDFSRWAQNLPGNGGMEVGSNGQAAMMHNAPTTTTKPMQYRASLAPTSGPYLQPAPVHAAHHSSTSMVSSSSAATASSVPSIPAVGPSPTLARGQQNVQFNRAVSFVEKIKNRFTAQPETYRAFLAILHSFHRDQRGIKEVYAQVQQLFRDEPDLLEEFTQFLPDTSNSSSSSSNGTMTQSQPQLLQQQQATKIHPGMLPPVGKFSSSSSTVVGAKRQSSSANAGNATSSSSSSSTVTFEKPKRARPSDVPVTVPSSEETEFFDKVKRYLDNRQLYADFLKCLSLFSQDILKLPDLLAMVHSFIGGNGELFEWFKRYINYKDTDGPIWYSSGLNVNTPTGSKASASSFAEAQVPELNLNALKRVGCYRIYPQGYRLCKASGRTLLCEEVLNDEMLSCPSFESEDSGFMASKKNQYEDALFKCEDERYEMDLLLEYNLATIAVLEPIARRLEQMSTQEERDAFRLDARLNGTSEIIYKKAIKRIYGDKGDDIYEYLQRNPAATLPVVLKRLKGKDEEWRRVQRDWNRVWAEVHIKNYYKALDHQGIDFKTSDKKTLTLRSLVGEVINIKEERSKQQPRLTTSTAHLSLSFSDSGVLKDLLNLINVSIQSGPNFSGVDRKSLSRFFSTFIPEFLSNGGSITEEGIDLNTTTVTSEDESETGSASGSESEESSIASTTAPTATTNSNNNNNNINTTSNQSFLLYANDALFGVLRILSIAYERLERMKQAAEASQNHPFFKERVNVVAQFLDLQTRQASMSVDEELAGGRDFYGVLLYLTEQLILGELEPGLFEEKVRYMFGTGGFVMFTFDKVLLALLRQCLGVLNDGVCENLIRLYDSWRTRRGPRTSEYSARLAAENILSSSNSSSDQQSASSSSLNLFRIEFAPQRRVLSVHLVDKLAVGVGASGVTASSIEDKWSLYVDNFVKLESNQSYLTPQSRVFLHRNHRLQEAQLQRRDELLIAYNLECKICINTYKIFYVENTEDLLTKKCRRSDSVKKIERNLPWN